MDDPLLRPIEDPRSRLSLASGPSHARSLPRTIRGVQGLDLERLSMPSRLIIARTVAPGSMACLGPRLPAAAALKSEDNRDFQARGREIWSARGQPPLKPAQGSRRSASGQIAEVTRIAS